MALVESFESSFLEGFDKIPIALTCSGPIHMGFLARGLKSCDKWTSGRVEDDEYTIIFEVSVCLLSLISRYFLEVGRMVTIGWAFCKHTDTQSVIINWSSGIGYL